MRFTFILFLIYAATYNAISQTNKQICEIVPDWKNITLVSNAIPDSLDRILIVTNRPFESDNKDGILFPNDISDFRQVLYLEVACHKDQWLIKVHENFDTAVKTLEPEKDVLLFVHGHGKTLPVSLSRAFQVKKRYNVSLILFDWPAKNSNFNKSLARVRRCSENFHQLLLDLKNYRSNFMTKNQSLNILAHSLGNYFLTLLAVNGSWQYLDEPFVDNLIFNAPAVRSKEHGEAISLLNFSHRKYVISNKNDMILRGAQMLTFGSMLGNKVTKPHALNTKYIDFTDIAGKEHTYFCGYHNFEYDNPAVFQFYNSIIHGSEAKFPNANFDLLNDNQYLIK